MDNNILAHYGVLGMKWGVRRYQKEDGSLTSSGKKRYSGKDKQPAQETGKTAKNERTRKIVKGVAIGSAAVAGTVLTAYLVKKYGHKNISDMASSAESGKAAVKKVLKDSSLTSTPISKVSAPKAEPKKLVEQVMSSVQRTPVPRAEIPRTQIPRTQVQRTNVPKVKFDIPQTYDFETLMKQNQSLLEKMYKELA